MGAHPLTTATGETTFAFTDRDAFYDDAKLHAFLQHWIYRDQTLTDLVMPAVWGGLAVFVAGLLIAIPLDIRRARERRQRRRLKGPELVTAAQFDRRTHADGIRLVHRPGLLRCARGLWIPRASESSHVLIMGDSGTGKSVLIRQILREVEAQGETVIVDNPALEFTPQFYNPDRGDLILNPLDARSP